MGIKTAFVFAAGKGTRMLPLTLYVPKPMVKVAGKMLIEHVFCRLEDAGVTKVVVNSHHLSDTLNPWLLTQKQHHPHLNLVISDETEELLETGGGLVKARAALGRDPFFTINGDIIWKDKPEAKLLSSLAQMWDANRMDMLLGLCPIEQAVGYEGEGDFDLANDGTLIRRAGKNPYVYCGVQIFKPSVLEGYSARPFSLRDIYQARKQPDGSYHRMAGMIYYGHWLHVGTVGDITVAENYLRHCLP